MPQGIVANGTVGNAAGHRREGDRRQCRRASPGRGPSAIDSD
jgi:hypothetical protein